MLSLVRFVVAKRVRLNDVVKSQRKSLYAKDNALKSAYNDVLILLIKKFIITRIQRTKCKIINYVFLVKLRPRQKKGERNNDM